MITAYFDDECRVLFVNRMSDFFTRAEYEKFMREHNEKKK
jgi:hypothetical protein